MAGRNAVAGISEGDLNKIVADVFNTLKPTGIFKLPDRRVEQIGTTISITIDEPPVVDLQDSALREKLETHFKDIFLNDPSIVDRPADRKEAIFNGVADELSKIGFTLRIPKSTIVLTYDPSLGKTHPATTLQCALELIASVTVNTDPPNPSLKVAVHDGNFTSINPPNLVIDSIVNGALLPLAVKLISEVVKPIDIPTLVPLPGFELSIPTVAIQNDRLIAYSALGRVAPEMPPPFEGWPAGAFVGADAALLTAAGNAAIAQINTPRDGFNFGIVSGEVHVNLGPLSNVVIKDNSSGDVSARIAADAGASLTVHTPPLIPNFSLGANIRGIVGATIRATVVNEELILDFQSLDHFDLEPDILGIPDGLEDFIDDLIDPLENALVTSVTNLILAALGDLKIPLLKLPSIRVPVSNGASFQIILKDVQTTELNPVSDSMVVAYGVPAIAP